MMIVGIKWLWYLDTFLKNDITQLLKYYIFVEKNIINNIKLYERESSSNSLSNTQTNNLNSCLREHLVQLSLLCR